MTIAELIKDLTEYAEDSGKGFDTEVRSYVGMSRQAAEERLKECEDEEYVFDDFLPISDIHEMNGFVYIRATDIPEAEPQESDHKCHTCKHYTSGENDGSCGSYICKGYSNWESEEKT